MFLRKWGAALLLVPPRVGTLQAPPELLGWVPERTPWSLCGVTGALEPGPRPGGEQGLGPGTTPQRVSWAPTSLPRCARFWKSLRVRSGRLGGGRVALCHGASHATGVRSGLGPGCPAPCGAGSEQRKGAHPGAWAAANPSAGRSLGPAHPDSQEPHIHLCLPRRQARRARGDRSGSRRPRDAGVAPEPGPPARLPAGTARPGTCTTTT